MEIAFCILSLIALALVAYVFSLQRRLSSASAEVNAANLKLNDAVERASKSETRAAVAEQANLQLRERLTESEHTALDRQREMIEQSETRFRLLAGELLSTQTREMNRNNDEKIGQLLRPLKDDIERFRHEVTDFYSKESAERFSLQERIKELIANNDTLGREARELSQALRGNTKVQGDWGEIVLERILENSGLRKGEEFIVQTQLNEKGEHLRDGSGRGLRPDVVVRYPGGKVMIIDSKVSLTAFVEYVNCEESDRREQLGKLHLASITKHVNELAEKNYQDYVGEDKLDFVMMFIPNEAAYNVAMTLNNSLWQKAYDKRVLIVSPTQLVASLKIVSQLWRHDRQTKNAIDIAEKSGAMYDKFVGFISDMERIEKSLNTARSAYSDAMNKLRDGRGSLITRAENLRELGIKTSKRLNVGSADD